MISNTNKPNCQIVSLQIGKIAISPDIQIRAEFDADTVNEYAAAMRRDPKQLPPITLLQEGDGYIIVDGIHRFKAAQENKFKNIRAKVIRVDKSEALKFALSANRRHGRRMTNADKQEATKKAICMWPNLADRAIAELVGVSHPTVASIRPQVVNFTTSTPPKRTGADGKKYPVPARSKPAPESPEARVRFEAIKAAVNYLKPELDEFFQAMDELKPHWSEMDKSSWEPHLIAFVDAHFAAEQNERDSISAFDGAWKK